MAIRIEQVDAGSEAEALGLAPGDELLSVDDNELNDTLDYDFYTDSSSFHLKIARTALACRKSRFHSTNNGRCHRNRYDAKNNYFKVLLHKRNTTKEVSHQNKERYP